MKLLKNEEILSSTNADNVILTNYRVYQSAKEWGKSFRLSIFLEDISSIETRYHSDIYLIIIGAIIALLGFTQYGNDHGGVNLIPLIGLVIGGIFLAIWWASRKNIIKISSNGGSSLSFQVENMSDEAIEDFTLKVLNAKLKRKEQIYAHAINV